MCVPLSPSSCRLRGLLLPLACAKGVWDGPKSACFKAPHRENFSQGRFV